MFEFIVEFDRLGSTSYEVSLLHYTGNGRGKSNTVEDGDEADPVLGCSMLFFDKTLKHRANQTQEHNVVDLL